MLQRKQRENRNAGVDVWDNVRPMKKKLVITNAIMNIEVCDGCTVGGNDCKCFPIPAPEKNMIEALVAENTKLKKENKKLESQVTILKLILEENKRAARTFFKTIQLD